MTSFLVKEAIQFAKEKGSKVNTCFLDVMKAFDQVWHNGLFIALYKGLSPIFIAFWANILYSKYYLDLSQRVFLCPKCHGSMLLGKI